MILLTCYAPKNTCGECYFFLIKATTKPTITIPTTMVINQILVVLKTESAPALLIALPTSAGLRKAVEEVESKSDMLFT